MWILFFIAGLAGFWFGLDTFAKYWGSIPHGIIGASCMGGSGLLLVYSVVYGLGYVQ